MTGVAYMSSDTPKVTRKRRSQYLVVREDMMMPNPRPRPAIMKMRKKTGDGRRGTG
jgi:hypothetical protein